MKNFLKIHFAMIMFVLSADLSYAQEGRALAITPEELDALNQRIEAAGQAWCDLKNNSTQDVDEGLVGPSGELLDVLESVGAQHVADLGNLSVCGERLRAEHLALELAFLVGHNSPNCEGIARTKDAINYGLQAQKTPQPYSTIVLTRALLDRMACEPGDGQLSALLPKLLDANLASQEPEAWDAALVQHALETALRDEDPLDLAELQGFVLAVAEPSRHAKNASDSEALSDFPKEGQKENTQDGLLGIYKLLTQDKHNVKATAWINQKAILLAEGNTAPSVANMKDLFQGLSEAVEGADNLTSRNKLRWELYGVLGDEHADALGSLDKRLVEQRALLGAMLHEDPSYWGTEVENKYFEVVRTQIAQVQGDSDASQHQRLALLDEPLERLPIDLLDNKVRLSIFVGQVNPQLGWSFFLELARRPATDATLMCDQDTLGVLGTVFDLAQYQEITEVIARYNGAACMKEVQVSDALGVTSAIEKPMCQQLLGQSGSSMDQMGQRFAPICELASDKIQMLRQGGYPLPTRLTKEAALCEAFAPVGVLQPAEFSQALEQPSCIREQGRTLSWSQAFESYPLDTGTTSPSADDAQTLLVSE